VEWPTDEELYAGATLGLSEEELPAEVARQLLVTLRGERTASPLIDAVRLGRAVGLSVAEMERMSGYTRQTLYSALRTAERETRRRPHHPRSTVSQHVLVALCFLRGEVPLRELAGRLNLPAEGIARALRTLHAEHLCELVWANPAEGVETMIARPTAEGRRTLRSLFNDLYLRRPDGFTVYLAVEPGEELPVADAARQILSAHEHTLIAASVAPSKMTTPELALTVHAPTSRVAVSIAADLWSEIRHKAGLAESIARIVDVHFPTAPPAAESGVIDAFWQGIRENAGDDDEELIAARLRYRGGVDERSLACRSLTSAARALRRSVGNEGDPRPINDGEAAFGELIPVSGLPLDRTRTPIKRTVQQALELGSECLGPFRGGELGSFREPGGRPRMVERLQPTQQQLEEIARLAGKAVGLAAKHGYVDPALEMHLVVEHSV
jgi:hypothetical protein